MDISAILVWALRIVLPIVLFAIYFKLQAPKDEGGYPGPSKHSYSRQKLMEQRAMVGLDCPVPESMANITLVDATRAPHLFAPPSNRRGGGGGGRKGGEKGSGGGSHSAGGGGERGGGEKGGGAARSEGSSAPGGARDTGGGEPGAASGGGSGGGGSSGGGGAGAAGSEKAAPAAGDGGEKAGAEEREGEPERSLEKADAADGSPSALRAVDHVAEQKMHVASLVNYVAFNRREQQRRFLLEEGGAPPPPPPRPRPRENKSDSRGEPTVSADMVQNANSEAQLVLSGAVRFKRADVAKKLYEQLVDSQVDIEEKSFALMIETCVFACDLKSASDFLMKMEAAGHCPDTELLDKVMDLYAQQKSLREMEKEKEMQAAAAAQQAAMAAQAQAQAAQSPYGFQASPSLSQKSPAPAARTAQERKTPAQEWEEDWEREADNAQAAEEEEEEYDRQGTYNDEWGAAPAADVPAALDDEAAAGEEDWEHVEEYGSRACAASGTVPAAPRDEEEEEEPPEEGGKKQAEAERPQESPAACKADSPLATSAAPEFPEAVATPVASPELPVPKVRGSGRKSSGKASAVEQSPKPKGSAPSRTSVSPSPAHRAAADESDPAGGQDQSYLPATPEPPSPVMPRMQPGSDMAADPSFQPPEGQAFSAIGLGAAPMTGVDFPGADGFAFAQYPMAGGEPMVQMVPAFMEYQPTFDGGYGCSGYPGAEQQYMTVYATMPPDGPRTKLSSKSRLFVPGGMQQSVPPPPAAAAPAASGPRMEEAGGRTRLALKASAKPFTPGASVTYNAFQPMWTKPMAADGSTPMRS